MSILALVQNFKPIIKPSTVVEKPIADNTIFKLHYRATTLIFLGCCVFVTAYSIFGEPIQCIGETKDDGRTKVANTYCYLGYTYTLPSNQHSDEKQAGIGLHTEGAKKYHNYYRWIPLMLFLQGLLFYVPHWIWKNWEDKRIHYLTKDIRGPVAEVKSEDVKKLKNLARYAVESLHMHNTYALMYYFCELLNFINVIVNMYLIDSFLDGEFMKYGTEVLQFTDLPQYNRTDPMIRIFPRVTKCDFLKVGPSGGLQNYDYLCVLALNNLNEKIYIFLWFWLILLGFISALPIVYSVALYVSPFVREYVLKRHYISKEKYKVGLLVDNTQIGDFFVWDLLGRNMSSKYYREFINELHAMLIDGDSSEKQSLSEES
ncbi:innexin inx3-like [Planococcus citri]|uniref:innexin inx3-like n=1 Tax=Planococcus citri TaxID=170843 RepID=UPI0031F986E0